MAPACGQGSGAKPPYTVTSEVVSHPTTQEIHVYAPEAKGSWPVVLALHGVGGSGQDMGELGTRLARQGTVVFAPTYRTDLSTEDGFVQAARDDECAYRYARSTAAQHGGDLTQPVTFVGWSLGASFAVAGGLTEQIDPTGQYLNCFGEVPRADVIVAISGCYFEYQGNKVTTPAFDTSQWGNKAADIYLAHRRPGHHVSGLAVGPSGSDVAVQRATACISRTSRGRPTTPPCSMTSATASGSSWPTTPPVSEPSA